MSIQVKAYVYTGDPRVINKHMTGNPLELECRITDPMNIMDPELFVQNANNIENYNYFTIGQRKYFKVTATKTHNNLIRIKLHEDVLSSWMPHVTVYGKILNASKTVSDEIDQGYITDVDTKISRIAFHNDFTGSVGESGDRPIIIIQCPLPTKDEPVAST